MIFATVGTQLPFDRLIRAIDEWAASRASPQVFAQIGPTAFTPCHLQYAQFIDAAEFRTRVQQAQVVVAHAGMGSIITALELGKPIVVMPRRADLGEHRNDHQLQMVRSFLVNPHIRVAMDEFALAGHLDALRTAAHSEMSPPQTSPQLLACIRAFIAGADDDPGFLRAGSLAHHRLQ